MAKIKFRSIYKYTEEFKATAVALSHLNGAAVDLAWCMRVG
jgi:transposase-like protein